MKNVLKGLSGLSLFLGTIVGLGIYRDSMDSKKSVEAKEKFSELEKLADLDSDGKLSLVERTLMYERLDSNCIPEIYYSPCLPWRENQNVSFGDLRRIKETIKEYN